MQDCGISVSITNTSKSAFYHAAKRHIVLISHRRMAQDRQTGKRNSEKVVVAVYRATAISALVRASPESRTQTFHRGMTKS